MDDSWIAVKTHPDEAEAEWEASYLREGDIPARVQLANETDFAIVVERERIDEARERLQSLEADSDGEVAPNADPSERDDSPELFLSSNSPVRDQLLNRAFGRAFIGVVFPPYIVSAISLMIRAVREPEPMGIDDYVHLMYAGLLVMAGVVFWSLLVVNGVNALK